ncbi:MMPL family transporter [Phytomonospora endophytica]|uniref:RND superfamily putative drug exporter n=1 Tax=Phytomonospora endophytica TaxID=714109 RepID=A0A841FKP6_9ACTN|nr:MMPL family transporter [Phytomonospora endophytica]MBB6032520.1 RND superfamily putative drug exporter [Phytomonospora endophytica]GIG66331.1 membrane protein [Phytomonospora endophytica]
MFAWWGRVVARARWIVLAAGVIVAVIGALWGTGVFGAVSDGGFYNENSPSAQAADRIAEKFGRQAVDVVVLYSSDSMSVDDEAFKQSVMTVIGEAGGNPDIAAVQSYYTIPAPQNAVFKSGDGHATYLAVRLSGADEAERADQFTALKDSFGAAGLDSELGGQSAIFADVNTQTQDDIVKAETLAMPILLILMAVIFGSVVAALTPLMVGVLAILGAFTVTRLLTYVTDVSVFAINIITIIGLGLAIDYALFVVNRFREELHAGHDRSAAISRTMATAGRTVTVSGVIIMLSLAGLLVFPLPFLKAMAYGGIAAVGIAMLGALTVLPALLAVLGPKVDAWRIPFRRKNGGAPAESRFWGGIGRVVMKRPVFFIVGVLGVLTLVASPFLHAKFGGVDERVLPAGSESRVVSEELKENFPGGGLTKLEVLVDGGGEAAVAQVRAEILDVPHVTGADPTVADASGAVLSVSYDVDPETPAARELVNDIRDVAVPDGTTVHVTGQSAVLDDQLTDLTDRLPLMALLVAGVTFLLLFLAFGSLLLPLKAILMNVVSIGASFGVIVWIFQDGHLADLLGFTPLTALEPTNLLLMLVLLFGLSTDYEVFLLSRVREEWDAHGDNTRAVVTGLQRTGGIISSAALLLIVVVAGFASGGIVFIKMIGIGMIVAILVDATLVRGLLVPATMRVLGRANWWSPKPLRRLYAKYGIDEGEPKPTKKETVSVG